MTPTVLEIPTPDLQASVTQVTPDQALTTPVMTRTDPQLRGQVAKDNAEPVMTRMALQA
jgi:hypothetical protein